MRIYVILLLLSVVVTGEQPIVVEIHRRYARRLHESQDLHHLGDNKFVVHNLEHLENVQYKPAGIFKKQQNEFRCTKEMVVYCNAEKRMELAHRMRIKGMKVVSVHYDRRKLYATLPHQHLHKMCTWLYDDHDVVRIKPLDKYKAHNNVLRETLTKNVGFPNTGTFRGQGEIITVSDTEFRVDHCAFGSSNVVPMNQLTSYTVSDPLNSPNHLVLYFGQSANVAQSHGTHCAATAAGLAGSYSRPGVASDAKIIGVGNPVNEEGYILIANVYYTLEAAVRSKSYIASFSWGGDSNSYGDTSRDVDQFMYNNDEMLVFVSSGNGFDEGTIASPATCKNCIVVGCTQNEDPVNKYVSFTSYGPTLDGRQKPEILAPGSTVWSAQGSSSCGSVGMSGTSMSTPAAAGLGAIFRQYLKTEKGITNPTSYLVRTLLFLSSQPVTQEYDWATGATINTQPTEQRQGFGNVGAVSILSSLDVHDRVTTLRAYNCVVQSNSKLAIAWNDLPSDLSPFTSNSHIYLNLDLCVDGQCTSGKSSTFRIHTFDGAGTYLIQIRAGVDSNAPDPLRFAMSVYNGVCTETTYNNPPTEPPTTSAPTSPTIQTQAPTQAPTNTPNADESAGIVVGLVLGAAVVAAIVSIIASTSGTPRVVHVPLVEAKYKNRDINVPQTVHIKNELRVGS